MVRGFKSHFLRQITKSPYFRDFFVVINGFFDNFLCINLMFIVNLWQYIAAFCYKLRTNCAQNCAQK